MIITSLTGGLGNQLFQYAMARRLAIQHKTELLLDTSGYGTKGERRPKELEAFSRRLALLDFRINARVASYDEVVKLKDNYLTASTSARLVRMIRRVQSRFLWKESHVVEREYRFQSDAGRFPDNVYLQGYWQSPKYFADIADLLREEIQPVDSTIIPSAKQVINELKEKYGSVVSVHVRRGDLAYAHEFLRKRDVTYGAPVSLEYLRKAIDQFSDNVCFLVFSDSTKDIQWCREHLCAKNIEFSDAATDLGDLFRMRFCDHHIIANSTFSWWAAWLDNRTGRRVIAPRVWSAPEAKTAMPTVDLIPADWQTI